MSDSSATPWTVACQVPLSPESQARILEWVSISSPGDLPDPGIEPTSPALPDGFLLLNHQGSTIYTTGILINTNKYSIDSVSLNNHNTTPYILELHHSSSKDFQWDLAWCLVVKEIKKLVICVTHGESQEQLFLSSSKQCFSTCGPDQQQQHLFET